MHPSRLLDEQESGTHRLYHGILKAFGFGSKKSFLSSSVLCNVLQCTAICKEQALVLASSKVIDGSSAATLHNTNVSTQASIQKKRSIADRYSPTRSSCTIR
jgi:hypothetical protein